MADNDNTASDAPRPRTGDSDVTARAGSGDADEASPDVWSEVTDPVGEEAGEAGKADAAGDTADTTRTHDTAESTESAESAVSTESTESGESGESGEAGEAASNGGGPTYSDAREILAAVAAGTLTPDEAATLLDRLDRDPDGTSEGTGKEADEDEVPATQSVTRLRIRAVGRRVRLIGEPFVTTVAVDGPHVVRQEGDTLVVTSEGEFGASLDGFTLTPPRSLRDVQQKFFELGRELSVRVNPALLVDAEVTAGSINAERLPHLEQVRVTAGSVRLRDVEGPLDLLVQAGSAQVEGRIHRGRSRLRTESGSLQLRLLRGSSVRIRPDTQLGRVVWEPAGSTEPDERTVGGGEAQLALEVVMGQATVKEAP